MSKNQSYTLTLKILKKNFSLHNIFSPFFIPQERNIFQDNHDLENLYIIDD